MIAWINLISILQEWLKSTGQVYRNDFFKLCICCVITSLTEFVCRFLWNIRFGGSNLVWYDQTDLMIDLYANNLFFLESLERLSINQHSCQN